MRAKTNRAVALGLLLLVWGCQRETRDDDGAGRAGAAEAVPPETLVVFVQPQRSDLARRFEANDLLEIELFAAYAGIPLRVISVTEGAPGEVALTPLIAFVNARGRAVYQGRYLDVDRLENFVRTFRRVPQSDQFLELPDAPVWRVGRMQVVVPIKITPLTGATSVAGSGDDVRFEFAQSARRAIEGAFSRFRRSEPARLGRSDRAFYMDFHPYRSPEGELFVTTELFSQFHCHTPVFSNRGDPLRGRWEERERVLASAARLLEEELVRQIANSDIGDAFDPVPADVPLKTWEEIGLPLPALARPVSGAATPDPDSTVGAVWRTVEAERNDDPRVLFRFAPPLDHYSGAAKGASGTLEFRSPELRTGWCRFDVPVSSVTMGHPDLDQHIRGPTLLDAERFPRAWFEGTFTNDPLQFGVQARATLDGQFVLRDTPVPLSATAFFELIVGEDGTTVLQVTGSFSLRLRATYGIDGPDGPEPSRDTMLFDFDFPLLPEAGPARGP
ncbi:MAG: YceI family protein [Planctomycetota bacterium]